MSQLLLLNPRKRRARKTASRKRRSPAQRAATARMLAANRSRSGVARNPARRRRRATSYRRNPIGARRRRSFSTGGVSATGVMGYVKDGAMMGVGAVAVDIIFGQVNRFLPANMATPVDTTGATNWLYFVAKAGVAIGIGIFGRKSSFRKYTDAAAGGAMAIMAYQIARSMLPAGTTLGAYMNPALVMSPVRNRAQLNGMSAYVALPGSAGQVGPGAAALHAAKMSMVRR